MCGVYGASSSCRYGTRRGLAFLVACLPCLLLSFSPHPPNPLPGGNGEIFVILCKGLRPLHPRGWTGRGTGSAGVGGARRGLTVFVDCLPCLLLTFLPPSPYPRSQSALPGGKGEIFVILLQGASPLASPGAGGARHWFGFEETIRFGIAGGRRLQLQSITNLRKVLGGLGASFKKPPTFLRSPVPSFSRS